MIGAPRIGIRLHGGLDPRRCAEFASAAEVGNFTSVWFAENPLERGVLAAASAAALATQRIEIGLGVWNPYLRHPAQIAMDICGLDELAQGRAALGIGSGIAAPIGRLGIDNSRPLAALRDAFHIVRGLLRGERVTYQGAVFSVDGAKLAFTPRRPDMPLLMAARGRQALALCGEIADGLAVSNMCPPGFTAFAAGVVREAAAKAGRAAPTRILQYAPCAAGDDRAAALGAIKTALAGMLKQFWPLARQLPAAREGMVAHSFIDESEFQAAFDRLQRGASPGEAIDQRFVDAFAVAGMAEECRARIAAFGEAGVTDLALTFVGRDPRADMAYVSRALL